LKLMPAKKKAPKTKSTLTSLKGWQQIASFLGQPINVAQRWAKSGMPIVGAGRSITTSPEDLNSWLGREAGGEPLHVASEQSDLSADLKRGLSYLKSHKTQGPRTLILLTPVPVPFPCRSHCVRSKTP
jgi:hypothetical protein